MEEIKQAALRYQALGLSVIPLSPQNKNPLILWREYQNTPAPVEMIEGWWKKFPNANLGIVCGAVSRLVVIDIDTNDSKIIESLQLPPTTIVKTGKGFHYYFQYPKNFQVPLIPCAWGEIRGNGGQVVAPPSKHPQGATYEWIVPLDSIDNLPEFTKEMLTHLAPHYREQKYDRIIQGVAEGERNSSAASFIGTIIRPMKQTDWGTAGWDATKNWNMVNKPPMNEKELLRTFQSICKLEFQKRNQLTESKSTDFSITKGAEMLTLETKSFPYLIDKLIPENAITSITADTGKGKSLFALLLAKAVASGMKLFDEFEVKKSKVFIIDQEMDSDIIISRYKSIIDEALDIDYMFEQSWTINEEKEYEWLKNIIINNQYGLVIFDTLTTIHSLEENDAGEMKQLNKLLLKLIQETKCTIIYLHHHRKLSKGDRHSGSSARGSTEINAKVASHLLLQSEKSDGEGGKTIIKMKIKQEKARRPDSITTIEINAIHDPNTKTTIFEYGGKVDENAGQILVAKSFILKTLNEVGGELTVQDIKEQTGIGENSIRNAFKELIKDESVDSRSGKNNRQHYSLRIGL